MIKESFRSIPLTIKYALLVICLTCLCQRPPELNAYQSTEVYFKNTDQELKVYRIFGESPGKTLLVIAGIQGNEPGGYMTADRLTELKLKKGNLIIIPRANFYSILMNDRGIHGDMNRKFSTHDTKDKDLLIVEKLKNITKNSDYLLHLHDGSGYYSPKWETSNRNPNMYGQSIIADCDRFYSKRHQQEYRLQETAERVCSKVNHLIENTDHHFKFQNHNTASENTAHIEQRKSATYFALTHSQIPAFGIETSKAIKSISLKVKYQTMVINAFMDEFGIVRDEQTVSFPEPVMDYILLSVNDGPPIAVYNHKEIHVRNGDSILIRHAEVNYQRGVSVDLRGQGSINDLGKRFIINAKTEIVIKKDNITCGGIKIIPDRNIFITNSSGPGIAYLILMVNHTNHKIALSPDSSHSIKKGDVLKILDLITFNSDPFDYEVNFKGFVGNRKINDGEDRGYLIDTSKDLMLKYSTHFKGREYKIEVTKNDIHVCWFYINIM